jgi:hypothetical protein
MGHPHPAPGALLQIRNLFDNCYVRWNTGPIRKRHVPEPERLRQLAAGLKGQADKLWRKADAFLAEAEALEAADQQKKKQPS